MFNFTRFKQLVDESKQILITTHVAPDADGIGSQIALYHALKKLGKNVICVNQEPLLPRYSYLDTENIVEGINSVKINRLKKIDLFIIVDANSVERIGNDLKNISSTSKELLFIDHHPTSKEFIALHCIDTKSAATGEIVAKLIHSLNIRFTYQMALALYTSIIIDTSSFQYPTVSPKTHETVASLLETGVSPPEAMKEIYGQEEVSYFRFLGKILSKTNISKDKKVIYVSISLKDLKDFDVDPEDTHGIINQLLFFKPAIVLCMFREINKDQTKVSFRSMGNVDVGSVAQALGGGGHSHSAATIINMPIRKCEKHVLKKIDLILSLDEIS